MTHLFHKNLHFTGLLWKIYKGFKKSTRQEVAIFVFEKKQLEKWPKDDREGMIETIKRGELYDFEF